MFRKLTPVGSKAVKSAYELRNGAAIAAHMKGGPVSMWDSYVSLDSETPLLRAPLLFIQRNLYPTVSGTFWVGSGSWNSISLALNRQAHLFHGEGRVSGMSLFMDCLPPAFFRMAGPLCHYQLVHPGFWVYIFQVVIGTFLLQLDAKKFYFSFFYWSFPRHLREAQTLFILKWSSWLASLLNWLSLPFPHLC